MKITIPAGHSPSLGLTGNYFKILSGSVDRVRATFRFEDGSHDEREVIAGVGFDFDKQFIDLMIESDVEADLELVALRGRVTDNRMSGEISVKRPTQTIFSRMPVGGSEEWLYGSDQSKSYTSVLVKNIGGGVVSICGIYGSVANGYPLELGESITLNSDELYKVRCETGDSEIAIVMEMP